jgi:hypothetical protein
LDDGFGVRNIKFDGFDAWMIGRDLLKQRLSSSCDDDLVASLMKTQRQAEADARGRTCDENGIASGLHGFLLVDKKGKIKKTDSYPFP